MSSIHMKNYISDLISFLMRYEKNVLLSLFALLFILSLFSVIKSRRYKAVQQQLSHANFLIQKIDPSKGLENNLNDLLLLISSIIDAPTYTFYIYDSKNQHYVLKSVRHDAEDFGKVQPSYSGLKKNYQKESVLPPMSISSELIPENGFVISREGEVPMLLLMIRGGRGAVRIGPVERIQRVQARTLKRMGEQLENVLEGLVKSEEIRSKVNVVLSSGKALQNISRVAINPQTTLTTVIHASVHSVGAEGGFFLQHFSQTNEFQIPAVVGMDQETERQLIGDIETQKFLHSVVQNEDVVVLKRGGELFYQIPEYVAAMGIEAVALIRVHSDQKTGILVFWFPQKKDGENLKSPEQGLIKMVAHDLGSIVNYQSSLHLLSKVYTNILKRLAQLMDNLNPFTVGYSELMSRYAIIIGRELGLPEDEIRDIALAAYLSNIGVLGLSGDLMQRDGKFTEVEYEMMKLHSEVGAAIISITIGNERVASYIMHHHERMDGNGYPSGLKGEEIPLGGRILGVIQTFLAKINGRRGRDSMPFDQALETLKTAAGAQLDTKVVGALLSWFKKKQADPRFSAKTLGACWEMCCTPSSICEHCPVYQRTDVNCFEVEDNNCRAHGKVCQTCFVRTEFMTRQAVKK